MGEAGLEVGEGVLEAFAEESFGFPAEQGADFIDVGAAAGGASWGSSVVRPLIGGNNEKRMVGTIGFEPTTSTVSR